MAANEATLRGKQAELDSATADLGELRESLRARDAEIEVKVSTLEAALAETDASNSELGA